MTYIADLHLHSAYAYACSKYLTLENLAKWAKLKGIDLLATADFTHPRWLSELTQQLTPTGTGLYQFQGAHFVLGTEVSCVYRQGGASRRVHVLLFAPDLDTVSRLNLFLSDYGNLVQDGRPTLRLSVRDLTEAVLDTNPNCIVIPAHVWTPWYGVFGSKSGFDSLAECFLDLTPSINAVETGLSSDPAMNWAIPELENLTIISCSDAHSLPKLAREVTAFEGELTYQGLSDALSQNRVAFTAEFYPEEGKYHYDGHRKCGISQSPEETLRQGGRCPVCRRPLTLGVLNRTRSLSAEPVLAERGSDGFVRLAGSSTSASKKRPPFIRLVPLQEIIATVLGQGVSAKRVQSTYFHLVEELGSELEVLINASPSDLISLAGEEIGPAILRARAGDVRVEPGYDGVFGRISIEAGGDLSSLNDAEHQEAELQGRLL
ncbi:MAG: DNA helicase UvrD [Chloroflexi bacterium]|nr:DNA helicase UvrD [Chloroflexota bacterium]